MLHAVGQLLSRNWKTSWEKEMRKESEELEMEERTGNKAGANPGRASCARKHGFGHLALGQSGLFKGKPSSCRVDNGGSGFPIRVMNKWQVTTRNVNSQGSWKPASSAYRRSYRHNHGRNE